MIKKEDIAMLKTYPELWAWIVASKSNEGPCARLELYRSIAHDFLPLLKRTDQKSRKIGDTPNVAGLADDPRFVEKSVADIINGTDGVEIGGMILAGKITATTEAICGLYARIVIAHAGDEGCDGIVQEFILAGMKIREKACQKKEG